MYLKGPKMNTYYVVFKYPGQLGKSEMYPRDNEMFPEQAERPDWLKAKYTQNIAYTILFPSQYAASEAADALTNATGFDWYWKAISIGHEGIK
jgi:hypothetical protein